jgi:hypothetical protein
MHKPVADPNKSNAAVNARKPYKAPVLTVYGTLGALTRSLGGNGLSDSMSGNAMTSTSP